MKWERHRRSPLPFSEGRLYQLSLDDVADDEIERSRSATRMSVTPVNIDALERGESLLLCGDGLTNTIKASLMTATAR